MVGLKWLHHRLTSFDEAVFFDKAGYPLPQTVLGCLGIRNPVRQAAIGLIFQQST